MVLIPLGQNQCFLGSAVCLEKLSKNVDFILFKNATSQNFALFIRFWNIVLKLNDGVMDTRLSFCPENATIL